MHTGLRLINDPDDLHSRSAAEHRAIGRLCKRAPAEGQAVFLRLVGYGLHPDLVVTDHLMPGLSGVDLARDLHTRRSDLPVLTVSGSAEADKIAPGFRRLTKPFRAEELAESLTALRPAGVT